MRRVQKNQSRRTAKNPAPASSQDAISREAFRIYQSRHGAPGDPIADWFEAERIVLARATKTAPRAAEAEAPPRKGGGRTRRGLK